METTKRKGRRKHDPDVTSKLFVGELDLAIFELLIEYRYLSNKLIALLLGRSFEYVRDRNKLLANHEYIRHYGRDRLPLHWPDYFMINDRGRDALVERGIFPEEIVTKFRENNNNCDQNFTHDFATCNAIASIEIGAKEAGYEFITWQDIITKAGVDTSIKMPCTIQYRFSPSSEMKHLNTKLIPDGLFGIRKPDGQVSFFAVELERGTPIMPTSDLKRPSLLKKVLAYQNLQKNRTYKSQLKIPNLRTIFLTESEVTCQNLATTALEIGGKTNQFLFGVTPVERPDPVDLFSQQFLRAGHPPTTLV